MVWPSETEKGWLLWKARRAQASYARALWSVLYVSHRLVDVLEETHKLVAKLEVEYGLDGQTVMGQPAESPFTATIDDCRREVEAIREQMKAVNDAMSRSTENALTVNSAVSSQILVQLIKAAREGKKLVRAVETQQSGKLRPRKARLNLLRAAMAGKEAAFQRFLAGRDSGR